MPSVKAEGFNRQMVLFYEVQDIGEHYTIINEAISIFSNITEAQLFRIAVVDTNLLFL